MKGERSIRRDRQVETSPVTGEPDTCSTTRGLSNQIHVVQLQHTFQKYKSAGSENKRKRSSHRRAIYMFSNKGFEQGVTRVQKYNSTFQKYKSACSENW